MQILHDFAYHELFFVSWFTKIALQNPLSLSM